MSPDVKVLRLMNRIRIQRKKRGSCAVHVAIAVYVSCICNPDDLC